MSRWDAARQRRKGNAYRKAIACLECRRPLGERYLYCSDECARESRTRARQQAQRGRL